MRGGLAWAGGMLATLLAAATVHGVITRPVPLRDVIAESSCILVVKVDRLDAKKSAANQPAPPFAVIPSVLIGGPLAVLAMLFPALFGSLLLVVKRWTPALAVASVNSSLYALYVWKWSYRFIEGTWWGRPAALWLLMTLVTLAGVAWAWRRHLGRVQAGADENASPGRREQVILWVLGLVLLVTLGYASWQNARLLVLPWSGVLVMAAGVWAAVLSALWRSVRKGAKPPARLPLEGVALVGTAFAAVTLGAALTTGTGAGKSEGAEQVAVRWTFAPDAKGSIDSSPLVTKDRVYVGAAYLSTFQGPYGVVYCLDRATGKKLWSYPADESPNVMKQIFSSPCLADGRLYIGEGFHQDADCHLYCFDAATGELKWKKRTGSHTESSPCVAGGKVYIGAGDDGLYCFDAVSGAEVWHYQKRLHIDANPLVVDGRLYCGGGVIGDAAYRGKAVFCLDAETKREIWFHETDLPVMAAPVVQGDRVFFSAGNGNFSFSEHPRAGALLCLDTADGREVWRYDVPDAVVTRPAADDRNVYFGSRDGSFYCVAIRTGRLRRKWELGSPVLASPALTTHGITVCTSGGLVCRLDPQRDRPVWQLDLAEEVNAELQLFSSPAVVESGDDESALILFGAGRNMSTSPSPALYCLSERTKEAGGG